MAVLALMLVAFAFIQLASDSLYASAAAPGSFPARISATFGVRVYNALDRVAPAPYVESTLARAALQRGDRAAALRYAVRMPPSSVRDGLLEQIAAARGEQMLAYEYAFAAPDIDGVQRAIAHIRASDPRRAYALESRFLERLVELRTHPDAVAHAWWTLGTIASQLGDRDDLQLAYRDYVTSAQRAPLDLTNLLGAANQAFSLHDWRDAERWYRAAIEVNPAAADGIAGIGLVALNERNDRATALRQLRAAQAVDPHSPLVIELIRELHRRS